MDKAELEEFKQRVVDLCIEYGVEICSSDADHAHLMLTERFTDDGHEPDAEFLNADDFVTEELGRG